MPLMAPSRSLGSRSPCCASSMMRRDELRCWIGAVRASAPGGFLKSARQHLNVFWPEMLLVFQKLLDQHSRHPNVLTLSWKLGTCNAIGIIEGMRHHCRRAVDLCRISEAPMRRHGYPGQTGHLSAPHCRRR